MNVPAIRAALLKWREESGEAACHMETAVVTVGLRACDEWDASYRSFEISTRVYDRMILVADILREAGVEVEG